MTDLKIDTVPESGLEKIQSFLKRYDWYYEVIENDTVMTGFQCDPEPLTMFIRYFKSVYYFSIPGLSDAPSESCASKYQRYLLDANYHMVMAKFSTDPKGRASLTVELPETIINYELFVSALYLLAESAQEHVTLLHDAATNPIFKSPYTSEALFLEEEGK
jgi:hypothetical protein